MNIAACTSWKFELRFERCYSCGTLTTGFPGEKLYYYQSCIRSDLHSLLVLLNEETQNPTGKLLRN